MKNNFLGIISLVKFILLKVGFLLKCKLKTTDSISKKVEEINSFDKKLLKDDMDFLDKIIRWRNKLEHNDLEFPSVKLMDKTLKEFDKFFQNIKSNTYNFFNSKEDTLRLLQKAKNKIQLLKEFSFIKSQNFKEYKNKLEKEELDIILGLLSSYLNDKREKQIFLKNIKTLLRFEYEHNYKFSMILMGAIIEFLLIRYCEKHDIEPEPINNRKGNGFANYVEAAIKNDIFGEKMSWKLVQTHLREFRNYIHIQKEVTSIEIDEKWYKIIKPVFEDLYKHFKL